MAGHLAPVVNVTHRRAQEVEVRWARVSMEFRVARCFDLDNLHGTNTVDPQIVRRLRLSTKAIHQRLRDGQAGPQSSSRCAYSSAQGSARARNQVGPALSMLERFQ